MPYEDSSLSASVMLAEIEKRYDEILTHNYDFSYVESYSYNEQSIDILQEIKDIIDDNSSRSASWFEGLKTELESDTTEDYLWLILLIIAILLIIKRYLMLG